LDCEDEGGREEERNVDEEEEDVSMGFLRSFHTVIAYLFAEEMTEIRGRYLHAVQDEIEICWRLQTSQ